MKKKPGNAGLFLGSSRPAGKGGPGFQQGTGRVAIGVGHSQDDFDSVVNAFQDAGIESVKGQAESGRSITDALLIQSANTAISPCVLSRQREKKQSKVAVFVGQIGRRSQGETRAAGFLSLAGCRRDIRGTRGAGS